MSARLRTATTYALFFGKAKSADGNTESKEIPTLLMTFGQPVGQVCAVHDAFIPSFFRSKRRRVQTSWSAVSILSEFLDVYK